MDETKVVNAMHRIEELYFQTNGKCYLSYSGGKDSTIILAIIKMCEDVLTIPKNGIPAVFCNTGIELDATLQFVKWVKSNYYENIVMIKPEKPFYWVLKNKGKPVKSKIKSEFLGRYQRGNTTPNTLRNLLGEKGKVMKCKIANKDMHLLHPDFNINVSSLCCDYLKKKPFNKYAKQNDIKGYITGERMAEGGVRSLNAKKRVNSGGQLCTKTKGNHIIKLPIIDWTDEDIENFIVEYHVPLSKAYTEYGLKRTGCFCCPFSLEVDQNLKMLYEKEPKKYKASLFWLKDVYIAQNVQLPFDLEYESERAREWQRYSVMRYEMMLKYRPERASRYYPSTAQMSIYDYDEENEE